MLLADATPTMASRLHLAAMGFAQVVFVAMNTVFIAEYQLLSNLVTAFLISWVWSANVRRVAFGDRLDRVFYASGAAAGSVVGTVLATWFTGGAA